MEEEKAKYKSLYNLRRMMRAEKDLDLLLDFIVEESARIVHADRASLFLYDSDSNELWSKIALGTTGTVRLGAGEGIAGEVFQSGKSKTVDNAYDNKSFNPEVDEKTGYKTKTLLCVPLINFQEKPIGVLQALNKEDGAFTPDDEETLCIFASNAAAAVENAELINKLEGSQSELLQENKALREMSRGKFFISNIIGSSPGISEVVGLIEKVAGSPLDVLITGESGTGKELAARMIHYNSGRRDGAFVDLNCAALPDSIIESELFGIEKGVATGVDRREGKIETADGGTLFLDEIGDMSTGAQAKLLRALQERKIRRLGGKKEINVDFRVVAATNKDLSEDIKQKKFREDLYYRLNVVHIEMPPLREIKSDIPLIAKYFLNNYLNEFGREPLTISDDALECLKRYPWPGNVRELENEIKRAVILAPDNIIRKEDLSKHITNSGTYADHSLTEEETETLSMKETVERIETKMIKDALTESGGNKQRASELLGITRQGLFKKMKRYNLS